MAQEDLYRRLEFLKSLEQRQNVAFKLTYKAYSSMLSTRPEEVSYSKVLKRGTDYAYFEMEDLISLREGDQQITVDKEEKVIVLTKVHAGEEGMQQFQFDSLYARATEVELTPGDDQGIRLHFDRTLQLGFTHIDYYFSAPELHKVVVYYYAVFQYGGADGKQKTSVPRLEIDYAGLPEKEWPEDRHLKDFLRFTASGVQAQNTWSEYKIANYDND
jgi:hypothetical protein